jgi:hypothetical protein
LVTICAWAGADATNNAASKLSVSLIRNLPL